MWDTPGGWANKVSWGDQFETFLIGFKKGQKEPEFIAGVRWGYYVYKDGTLKMDWPNAPEFISEPPPELGHALGRWNALDKVARVESIKHVRID